MTEERFRKAFLLVLVISATFAFAKVLESFLMTILMAAIVAGLAHPLYKRLLNLFGGRRALASASTLILTLVLVVGPLIAVFSIVVSQAIRITTEIGPIVQRLINEPTYLDQQLERIPWIHRFEPYREQILTKAGDVVNTLGGYLVSTLSSGTQSTFGFILDFFLLLYTMFFLLMDGPSMLKGILNHLPLHDDEKGQMVERFMAVTRAAVRGTVIIGVVQGGLAGLAFSVVGIPDALFWTVVMVVMSVVPVIGGALIWVPACIVLIATGQVWSGVLLAVFCSIVVGSIDNLLRPWLVGREAKLHDLTILFSTLGGIVAFGPVGFIIGPILAGLFVTSWEIFAIAYRDQLRDGSPRIVTSEEAEERPHADVLIKP